MVSRFESGTRIAVDADPAWKGARALFLRDRDGAVFERELPGAAYEDATLQGQYAQTSKYIKTYRDEKGMYYLKDVWGNSVKAKTLNGTYVYRAADNAWGDGQPYAAAGVGTVNGETAAADALISVWANAMTYQHIYSNITFQPIQVWVHEPVTGAFSWADTNNVWHIELGYKDPSAIIKTPMTDIETVAHEAGHHVLRDTAGVISYTLMGEQGGIIEGCADIFGINASFYLPDALHPTCYGLNQICLWSNVLQIKNDWIFGNITGLPSALRSFVDPTVPAWSPSIANVTAHSAGGPLRRMYYFLSVGVLPLGTTPGAPSWDLPQRDSIFLPQGMTGIGVDEASRIWWQTINGLYFSGVTDYVGLRTAMLNAASVLYGKPHTPQYKAVEDAWAAVNVGPPADRDPPVVTLTEVQKSRTLAEITVDIAPDPSGISSGTVTIMSGFSVPPPTVASCTSHCVFTFARPSTTPGAATASGWRSPTVPETPR
ncbi:MAG: M4 family metallopeptidase [Myxococcaceae bacterium]|nr:M4 family metallopeptidase [Myxococcaceae bacterium]